MHKYLPQAAAAATGLFVGSTIVATRFVIDQTDPFSLAFLRYTLGFLCLLLPLIMAKRMRFQARDLIPVALLGIAQFGILVALMNFGLQHIPSALGALIFATFPMLTLVLAATLRLEALTFNKLIGVLLTILGVGLALGDRLSLSGVFTGGWIGEAALFGSALTGAVCSVLYRPYLQRYPTLQVTALAMFGSVLFLAVPAAWNGLFSSIPQFTTGGWLAVVFIGGSSAIGYYLWLWALEHSTPTKVTVFLTLSPITATALGATWLSEEISTLFIAGLVCVAGGLWVTNRQT